jgi:hypothetical protein
VCAAAAAGLAGRGRAVIDTFARTPQSELVVGLMNLLDRNRLALVVLAASFAAGARTRAERLSAECAAVRWLARNSPLVRHFLDSLLFIRSCARHAGYRALRRAHVSRTPRGAPRRVRPVVAYRLAPAGLGTPWPHWEVRRVALMRPAA